MSDLQVKAGPSDSELIAIAKAARAAIDARRAYEADDSLDNYNASEAADIAFSSLTQTDELVISLIESKQAAERERGEAVELIETQRSAYAEAQRERDAAEARARTAEEALKPFAKVHEETKRWDLTRGDDEHAWGFNRSDLTWGDFRRAAEALTDNAKKEA